MSFTVARVVAYNGKRGLAVDGYGKTIRFYTSQVYYTDIEALCKDAVILVYSTGFIELASSSFLRFRGMAL